MMNLLKLQVRQYDHDRRFHQDIFGLPTQDRLKHFTLHFAKYCGNLHDSSNECTSIKIYTDILICCLSLANTLNLNLSEKISYSAEDGNNFLQLFCISLGKIAKACEALDHLESYPYREVITEEVTKISAMSIIKIESLEQEVALLLSRRWSDIEKKSIFSIPDNIDIALDATKGNQNVFFKF